MLLPMLASADVVAEIDGINYYLHTKSKRAEVIKKYPNNYSGAIVIPNTVVYDDITYDVTSIGYEAFKDCSGITSIDIPNSVIIVGGWAFKGCSNLTTIIIPNSVRYLGSSVFWDCSRLNNVTIGNSVKSIGLFAFSGCKALTSINIPNSVTTIDARAFQECSGLTSITFGNSVTSIGSYAFYNCSSLKSIILPNSVTTIEEYAFRGCTSLSSFSIPNSVTYLGGGSFNDCSSIYSITIPNTVTYIGHNPFKGTAWYNNLPDGLIYKDNAFLGYKGNEPKNKVEIKEGTRIIAGHVFNSCKELTSVIIPNTVISIGEFAFYNCRGLTSIDIPNSVLTIGHNAFYFCTNLKSVTLGNSVESIGEYAFEACNSLASITIPNSVRSIGNGAFAGCKTLYDFSIPNNVEYIGERAFGATLWYNNLPDGLIYKDNILFGYKNSKPKNTLEIIEGTRIIAYGALDACEDLTSITIPNSVISIEEEAFKGCSNLTSITIPNSVTSIGDGAFMDCKNLPSITIPNSVNSIGEWAFQYCNNLREVYSQIEHPFSIGYYVFCRTVTENFTTATLYVPDGTKEKYRATDFWNFFDNILEEGEVTLTAKNYTREYGEENPKFDFEITEGKIESGIPSFSCSATKTSPVGTYDIIIEKGTLTNKKANLIKGTLTITKAPLTISAGNYTKEVGEANPTFTPTFNGFKNGETKSVLTQQPVISCTATKDSPAGNYPIIVSGAEAQNYNINYVNGILTVRENPDNIISFADLNVKAVCIKNWDTNDDGELSKQEAAAVMDLGKAFQNNKDIKIFYELPYFTGLTSIGSSVFAGCNGLKSIIIPDFITSIDSYAFSGCINLPSINIPNSVTIIGSHAFYNCYSLLSVIIGSGVVSIGSSAFYGTNVAKTIWLTNTPPSGYNYATGKINYVANENYNFSNNSFIYPFISSIFIVDGIRYVPVSPSERTCDAIDCVYDESIVNANIPSKVTYKGISMKVLKIQPYTCYNNKYIQKLTCENDGDIAQYAFCGCLGMLDAICNSNGIISDYVFSGCNNLKSIRLGERISSIGDYSFSRCSSLEFFDTSQSTSLSGYMYFSKSLNHIGNYAFNECKGIENIVIEDRDEELTLGSNGQSPLFSSFPLNSVYIGGDISYNTSSYCGYSPFYRNTSLRTVVITDKETEISENEFYGCTNLQSFSIGDGVITFGNWAFSGCSSLKSLSFGTKLKTIGQEAFSDCTAVTEIYSKAFTPPVCNTQALDDINKWECKLYVPTGSVGAYQTANQWKEFFFIEEFYVPSGMNGPKVQPLSTEIYDMRGQILKTPKKGINIIKNENGERKKVVIK